MSTRAVSWRRAVGILAATAALAGAVVAVVGSDGLPAVDATSTRAARWFVHRPTGRIVLADGLAGRALARVESGVAGDQLSIADGTSASFLVDMENAAARQIDSAALRLGAAVTVSTLTAEQVATGVSLNGLVVVDEASSEATIVSPDGETLPFEVPVGGQTLVAPDGTVWNVDGDDLVATTPTGSQRHDLGTDDVVLTLVGSRPLVLDRDGRRARLGVESWFDLPDGPPSSELTVQRSGPAADCGWIGGDDDLWCVGSDGITEQVRIDGLDIDGTDVLGIAGDAGAVIRLAPPRIDRFDWRDATLLDGPTEPTATVPSDAQLEVSTTSEVVWIDDTAGDLLWAVHPWGLTSVDKNDASIPLLEDSGEVIAEGSSDASNVDTDEISGDPVEREPDNDGVNDAPVAVDDAVSARAGRTVPVAVTANDWDPDGDPIAVIEVDTPAHGTVSIVDGDRVQYQPEQGYAGLDRFDYTITDPSGLTASATVVVELFPVDAANRSPVGRPDDARTSAETPVVIDVLANDRDPERDSLRIASIVQPAQGTVTETEGPAGQPALLFTPVTGQAGDVEFEYSPADAFDAVGDPTTVTVTVAEPGADNSPPLARPDAARTRRNSQVVVPVLANDIDPDGDQLILSLAPTPGPEAVDVIQRGADLLITPRAGAPDLFEVGYVVSDGHGHDVAGRVLVVVVPDSEPNRAPLANADRATVVIGRTVLIDVLANDSDPDNDPLRVLEVIQPEDRAGQAILRGNRVELVPGDFGDADTATTIRFAYVITDGFDHEVTGEVAVTVLPEPLPVPPFARDDSATTDRDVPVVIDVLSNDGDPSGEIPTVAGSPSCVSGGTAVVTPGQQVRFTPPTGRTGVFRCTYEVANSRGARAGATIIVTVQQPPQRNRPPQAAVDPAPDLVVGEEVPVPVLVNDTDPDGDLLTLREAFPTPRAGARVSGEQVILTGLAAGPTTIRYQISDPDGEIATGQITVTVVDAEPEVLPGPPVPIDDVRSATQPTGAVAVAVLDNDQDGLGEVGAAAALTLVGATQIGGPGATVATSGNLVVITPNADAVGEIVVEYVVGSTIDDQQATGRVVLAVLEQPNRPPQARPDDVAVDNGTVLTFDVRWNDSDPDGDPLGVTIIQAPDPALGQATVEADGQIRFVAQPGADGVAQVGYRISDGALGDESVLRIEVRPCTVARPHAPDVVLFTPYATPITVDLAQHARDGAIATDPGAPFQGSSGTVTPPPGENGTISFGYSVRNTCNITLRGTVTIDVNRDPVAGSYATTMGRLESRTVGIGDLASDDEQLRIVSLNQAPAWATITGDGAALSLAPDRATGGTFQFGAVVADPGGLRATVPISVELVNLAPVAVGDSLDLGESTEGILAVLANDSDPEGDAISIQVMPTTLAFPDGTGTITRLPDGRISITTGGGEGTATFRYSIRDAAGAVSPEATVTVTARRNDPPTAGNSNHVVQAGSSGSVVLNASDPDGDPLVVSSWAAFGSDGQPVDPELFDFSIEGIVVSFTVPTSASGETGRLEFTVRDPGGLTASGVAYFEVTPPNPPPTTTTTTTTTVPPTTTTTLAPAGG